MPALLLGLLGGMSLAQGSGAPLAILAARPVTSAPAVGSLAEVRVELSGTYRNPFDPDAIRVDARVETPSGKSYIQPAYFARDYADGLRGPEPKGDPYWNLRFMPMEIGPYRITLSAADASGTTIAKPVVLQAVEGKSVGYARVSERDRRYFETDAGTAIWPLGADLSRAPILAGSPPGEWVPRLEAAGANLVRVVLGPESSPLSLLRPNPSGGFGALDLAAAWRLERLVAALRGRAMRVQIALASGASLRDAPDGGWAASAWNRRNGGPLDYPTDFWNSATARRVWRSLARYLVARFGADPTVLAWELWDDADRATGYSRERVRAWHSEAATELRGFDAFARRPITTSVSDPEGWKDVELQPELDFLQTHVPSDDDPVNTVAVQGARKGGWGRPHMPRIEADRPDSPAAGDPMWAALTSGAPGALVTLPPEGDDVGAAWSGLSRYVRGIEFGREGFRPTRPQFGYLNPGTIVFGDLDVGALPLASTLNSTPRTILVRSESADRVAPSRLPARGTSPIVTFDTAFPRRVRFEAWVKSIGGTGGRIVLRLNGDRLLTRDVSAEGSRFGIDVPAGRRRIEVLSTGDAPLEARFDFPDALVRRRPGLDAWALVGERTVIAWMRNEGGADARLDRGEREVAVPPSYLRLDGLAAGPYDVQIWDPTRGEILSTIAREVPLTGVLTVPLPAIGHSLAVKAVAR